MQSFPQNRKPVFCVDENQEWILKDGVLEGLFGLAVETTSARALGVQGEEDAVVSSSFASFSGERCRVILTTDKKDAKKAKVFLKRAVLPKNITSTYDEKALMIGFSNNTYTKEEKLTLFQRLFRIKGFKVKEAGDFLSLARRYAIIFIGEGGIRYFLRDTEEWKFRAL